MPTADQETHNDAAHVAPDVELEFWGEDIQRREKAEAFRLPLPGWLSKGSFFSEYRERVEMRREIATHEAAERLSRLSLRDFR